MIIEMIKRTMRTQMGPILIDHQGSGYLRLKETAAAVRKGSLRCPFLVKMLFNGHHMVYPLVI